MSRIALKCLLALMLCLNGFGMPSAMAHVGVPAGTTAPASAESPCHEDMSDAAATDKSNPDQRSEAHDDGRACCANGQCFCGCIASAVFDLPLLAPALFTSLERTLAADGPGFPLARSGVLQRPPIR
ncbi:MAG: CopL family metal-binding regulatory protein [Xanthomonadales bacterium]|nr:CopL family metal-binding regulatory protein [Xanthomonadales bacterium]